MQNIPLPVLYSSILFHLWGACAVYASLDTHAALGSLVIESDGMECNRADDTCIAKGNVLLTKGAFNLKSDTLVTTLRKTKEGKQEIWRVDASGNVKFKGNATEEASAPFAFYDIDASTLILKARANPHDPLPQNKDLYPTMQKDQQLVRAQEITIYFVKSKDNKTELERVEAKGEVILSTPEDIAYGDFATYEPGTKLATLTGHVVIDRNTGRISGTHAQVNLDTGVSKMLSNPPGIKGSNGRVQVLLKPKGMSQILPVSK